ncbi:MAG: SRPBCC domain-containing protein [Ktedonobacterales bacterium]
MRIEGAYTFPGVIDRVFARLVNPDALARSIPGCERLTQFGPPDAAGATIFEARLRLGERRQPYTATVKILAVRRPAYLRLEIQGRGPAGPLSGQGSIDLVEQERHTIVAYTLTLDAADLPSDQAAATQAGQTIARSTCANIADDLYAEWAVQPAFASIAGLESNGALRPLNVQTERGQIITLTPLMDGLGKRSRFAFARPWAQRAVWMGAGLALGLAAIALTLGVVRKLGGHND